MIRGVIFDKDGVMVDTERLFLELWLQIMRERGLPEHRDEVVHCIGLNHRAIQEYLDERLDFDYWSVMQEIDRRTSERFAERGVPVKQGLYELLDRLDQMEIPYAVATSSRRERTEFQLEQIGVLHRLRGLVTGDMVEHGKPAPDIFQKAAETLDLPPAECMVLEDSPHGILAAHRAGCLPVMVPDLKAPDPETERLLYAKATSLFGVIELLNGT